MRVVLDSNILVSFALGSQRLIPLFDAWKSERITVLTTGNLRHEVAEVLSRDKLARYISDEDRQVFLSDLTLLSEHVEVTRPFPEFRDPKDSFLLALLRDTDAKLLVTGDGALLALAEYQGKPILSPATFISTYLK